MKTRKNVTWKLVFFQPLLQYNQRGLQVDSWKTGVSSVVCLHWRRKQVSVQRGDALALAWWRWCQFCCTPQCFQIPGFDLMEKMPLPECKPVILVLLKKPPCEVITVTKVGIHPTLSSHLSQASISAIYMLILEHRKLLFSLCAIKK